MIINGNPACDVQFWSKHLVKKENDRAEVVEMSGLLAEDLSSALKEMQAIADQSRCHRNFLYQANINPRDSEHLSPEQWREAVDTLEKNLGLEGHQRIVVEHEKEGRVHRHVIWNRVDTETLRVADMGGNYYTHERTARELEKRFGLEPTPSLHGEHRPEGRPERTPELWEQRAASRSQIDPKAIKQELTEMWRASESGEAFAAALEERGYVLAKGDRRDFCVVDHAGDAHSLARRLDGVRAKEVREHLADIDREALPTVAEAREAQHKRFPTREDAAYAWANRDGVLERGGEDDPPPPYEPDRRESKDPLADFEASRVESPTRDVLMVADAMTGVATSLVDFVGSLLDGRTRKAPTSPEAKSRLDNLMEMRRAEVALENIRDSMERGENLRPSDLIHLTANHLENIRLKGDDYMRYLIEDMQKDEERKKDDYGRTRER